MNTPVSTKTDVSVGLNGKLKRKTRPASSKRIEQDEKSFPGDTSPTPPREQLPPLGRLQSPFSVVLRGLRQPRVSGRLMEAKTPLEALQNALGIWDYPFPEPVIEWHKADQLAVLDIDYHGLELAHRPQVHQMESLARLARPQAALSWVTHGRGLKLIYTGGNGFTAHELAACAAVSVHSLDPTCTTEILTHTRHPAYSRPDHPAAGSVNVGSPTCDIGALARWLGKETDQTATDDWLAARGLQRGAEYDHSYCPLDLNSPSHGEPVFIGDDDGEFCRQIS